ncbi:MAG: class I SAM-dependent methyltransferase [Nanoarchaeota archaeon]
METEYPEFDRPPTRGINYVKANIDMPWARQREVHLMLDKINPSLGETIADFGCGRGVLTFPLAKAVGPNGKVVALDNSNEVLKELKRKTKGDNIQTKVLSSLQLPLEDNILDAIVTLASLHHIKDKEFMFKEFSRVLKKGGRLVVGDVAFNTPVQRYFDNVVDKHCSTGHKHKFLDEKWAQELCKKNNLKLIEFSINQVPWIFNNENECKTYIHTIHDIQCTPEQFLEDAKKYLKCEEEVGKFFLDWQLFYLTAIKE